MTVSRHTARALPKPPFGDRLYPNWKVGAPRSGCVMTPVVIIADSQCGTVPVTNKASLQSISSSFLPSDIIHLAVEHQSDVCSLSCRAYTRIHPITGWLSLLPTSHTRTPMGSPCGSLSLERGRCTGLPRFAFSSICRVRCLLSTGRCVVHDAAFQRRHTRLHCLLGPSLTTSLACYVSRSLSQIHTTFTIPTIWPSPG
jgi:hypothetical protein